MAHRFHTEVPLVPGLVSLGKEETQHIVVSRVKPGEQVVIFAGDGIDYPATILDISRHGCTLQVGKGIPSQLELKTKLVICAPLPKGDREQFLLEKLTEIGATRFVPLKTARSVIHPEPKRLDRLRRHVVEASKQCERSKLMEIANLQTLDELVAGYRSEANTLWFGHVPEVADSGWSLPGSIGLNRSLVIVVGPEGGLDLSEIHSLQGAGWHPCALGRRKLRIETAAILLAANAVRLLENTTKNLLNA